MQEASVDPLGLLRDTKLQHSLPLASAYAALLDYPPTNEQLKRQRARLDPANREPLFTNFNRYDSGLWVGCSVLCSPAG